MTDSLPVPMDKDDTSAQIYFPEDGSPMYVLSVLLPRERIERLRKMALTDARKFRKDADGAAKHGPDTKRNATWVAECAANAVAESAIVALCDAALQSDVPATLQNQGEE